MRKQISTDDKHIYGVESHVNLDSAQKLQMPAALKKGSSVKADENYNYLRPNLE